MGILFYFILEDRTIKLTKADIDHKAKKMALALVSDPVYDIESRIDRLTRDLICTMGIRNAKKTRLQVWRELKQIKENLKTANQVTAAVGRKLRAEGERGR